MANSLPSWQQSLYTQWQQFLRADKIPHAILLQGAPGLGKASLVKQMVKTLFCETRFACGYCRHCHWLQQNSHPDCLWIQPEAEGKAIKVASIREAIDWLQLSPLDTEKKVLVIQSAEALNTASSNALLKTLEEPSPSTLIILTSEMPELLLPTVRSRCQKFLLPFPSAEDIKNWFTSQGLTAPQIVLPGMGPYALLTELSEEQSEIREAILVGLENVFQHKVSFVAVADKLKSYAPLVFLRYAYAWVWERIEKATKALDKEALKKWLRFEKDWLDLKRGVLQGANLNWQLQLELLLEKLC